MIQALQQAIDPWGEIVAKFKLQDCWQMAFSFVISGHLPKSPILVSIAYLKNAFLTGTDASAVKRC